MHGKQKFYLLFFVVAVTLLVVGEALAVDVSLFGGSAQQCSIQGWHDVGLAESSLESFDIQRKRKGDGDLEQIFHHVVQKLIDIWLAVVAFVIDLVCSLFQSIGYRCG